MASIFERKARRVLPNWRSVEVTLNTGELNSWQTKDPPRFSHSLSIDDYLLSWDKRRSLPVAGDLLSAAFVNGLTDNPAVKEAASFVLSSESKQVPDALSSFAEGFLAPKTDVYFAKVTGNDLKDEITRESSRQIRRIKVRLGAYPYNPVLYVELARLYLILGHHEKASRNMGIALQLVPENRYILRSAARLYARLDRFDHIHGIIRKSDIVKHDPWVTSAEIALATIMGRNSRFVKRGLQMIDSGNYSPHTLTELASSIGTLEFFNGNIKMSKKLLRTALISPNDNSLAQAEWISNEVDWFEDIDPAVYSQIENKYEALAEDNYFHGRWDEALDYTTGWFYDLPFSNRPVVLGWHIADSLLGKSEIGRDFLKAGLLSHPDNVILLNNLAYSLALENRTTEAEVYVASTRHLSGINQVQEICLTATKGLIAFRKGLQDEGRSLYQKAIDEIGASNEYLHDVAVLNLAREEILSGSDYIPSAMAKIEKTPSERDHPDVRILKRSVMELYEEFLSR